MECQLKEQGNVEDEENDYNAGSRSIFRVSADRTSNTKLLLSKVIVSKRIVSNVSGILKI